MVLDVAQLLVVVAPALVEPVEVNGAQRQVDEHQQHPEGAQADDLDQQEDRPQYAEAQLRTPEEGLIHFVRLAPRVVALELPDLLPVLVVVAPPPQSHQQPAGDVLHHPEICGTQQSDEDEEEDGGHEPAEEIPA